MQRLCFAPARAEGALPKEEEEEEEEGTCPRAGARWEALGSAGALGGEPNWAPPPVV